MVRDLVTAQVARPHLRYADIRLEVIEGKYAARGERRGQGSGRGRDMGFGVRVLAGTPMAAPGYFGRGLGEADIPNLERVLLEGLYAAYRRAMANAEWKAQARGKFGAARRVARRHAPASHARVPGHRARALRDGPADHGHRRDDPLHP